MKLQEKERTRAEGRTCVLHAVRLAAFSRDSDSEESACSAGDRGSIPGLGRPPGEGNGCPLQYSGLENSMDSTVHGVAKSRTQLSDLHLPG